jgi:hypothetical protein
VKGKEKANPKAKLKAKVRVKVKVKVKVSTEIIPADYRMNNKKKYTDLNIYNNRSMS